MTWSSIYDEMRGHGIVDSTTGKTWFLTENGYVDESGNVSQNPALDAYQTSSDPWSSTWRAHFAPAAGATPNETDLEFKYGPALELAQQLGLDPSASLASFLAGSEGDAGKYFAGATDYNNQALGPGLGIRRMLADAGLLTPQMEARLNTFVDEGNTLKDARNAAEKKGDLGAMIQFGTMLAGLFGGGFMGAFDAFNPLGTIGAAETSPIVAELGSIGLSEAAAANAALGGTSMGDLAATAGAMGVPEAAMTAGGLGGYLADPSQAAQFSGELGGKTVGDIQAVQNYMPNFAQSNAAVDAGAFGSIGASEAARYSNELGGRTEADIGATRDAVNNGSQQPGSSVTGTEKSFTDKLRDKAIEKGASKALDYFMRPAYDYTGTGAARIDNGASSAAGINPFRMGNLENLFGGDIDAITAEAERQLGFSVGRQGLQESSVEAEGKEQIDAANQGYKQAVDTANKTAEQIFQEQQQQTKAYGDQLAAAGYGTDQITQALGELPDSADAYVDEPDIPDFSIIDLVARGGSPLPSRKKKRTSGASAATPGEETEDYGGAILRT